MAIVDTILSTPVDIAALQADNKTRETWAYFGPISGLFRGPISGPISGTDWCGPQI
jgi:hypothetical protein